MRKSIISLAALIGFILVSASLLYLFNYRLFRYAPNANSMQPAFSPGDICVSHIGPVYDVAELERGMVILFRHPQLDYLLTKRIIGLPGDWVQVLKNHTIINGNEITEPYVSTDHVSARNTAPFDRSPIFIPENKLFVAGDNRRNSMDSRYQEFGLVDVRDVQGRPLLMIWSEDGKKVFSRP